MALAKVADEQQALDKQLPMNRETLTVMVDTYAKKSLRFAKDDDLQEQSDKTVANNVEEIEESLRLSREAVRNAEDLFGNGKILQAALELTRAHDCCVFAGNRALEIKSKSEKLAAITQDNATALTELEQQVVSLRSEIDHDARISASTSKVMEKKVLPVYDEVLAAKGAESVDPYEQRSHLEDLRDALNSVQRGIEADRELHEEVVRQIAAVRQSLAKAVTLSDKIERDTIRDSSDTNQSQVEISRAASAFEKLESNFANASRGDWADFNADLVEIASRINSAVKTIKAEDAMAREALENIGSAAASVDAAGRWSGKYGITITGSPGADALRNAQQAIADADYDSASRWITIAYTDSSEAITAAEKAVEKESSKREAKRQQKMSEQVRAQERYRQNRSSTYSGSSSSDTDLGSVMGAVLEGLSHISSSSSSSSDSGSIFGSSGGSDTSSSISDLFSGDSSGGSDGTW